MKCRRTEAVAAVRHEHLARGCYRQLDRYHRLNDDIFYWHHQCYRPDNLTPITTDSISATDQTTSPLSSRTQHTYVNDNYFLWWIFPIHGLVLDFVIDVRDSQQHRSAKKAKILSSYNTRTKGKVKVWVLVIVLLTWADSWTAALYNLGSGSWLARASGAEPHYWEIGPIYFLVKTVAEPFSSDQTLIWALNFGLSPDPRLAQPNCYKK